MIKIIWHKEAAMDNNNTDQNVDYGGYENTNAQANGMPQGPQPFNGAQQQYTQPQGAPPQYGQPPMGGYPQQYGPPQYGPPPFYNQPYGAYPPPVFDPYDPRNVQPKEGKSGFGIASLVMGILSVLGGVCVFVGAPPFALLGIIFGIIAIKVKSGKSFAIAGIILSVVALVGGYLMWDILLTSSGYDGLWDFLTS